MAPHPDDVLAVSNLKARYCASLDLGATHAARARALLSEIFTPDAEGDYGFGVVAGPALLDFLSTALAKSSEWAWHSISSPRIEPDGDGLRADWTTLVVVKRPGREAPDKIPGRYRDRFERVDGVWRIRAVTFRRAGEEIFL